MLVPDMKRLRRLVDHPIIRQQGRFLAVGVVCTVIDFGVFNGLWKGAQLDKILANSCSFVVSCAASFALNRLWTFELGGRVDWVREAVPFVVISAIGLGLQNAAIWATAHWLSTGVLLINAAKVAGVGTIWLVKFFAYRNYVFVDRRAATSA
jgi:putative flippase GtrA